MRNRYVLLTLALVLAAGRLSGDWRVDAAARIQSGDFDEARRTLDGIYADLDSGDKPEASVLLAFLCNKLKAFEPEQKWLLEFFFTQEEANPDFSFLESSRSGEVLAYLNGWRLKYPRLSGVWIITRKGDRTPAAPLILELGLDTKVEMLYKFSDEHGALRGGLLHRGLNLIALDAARFFDSSRTHVFLLDLKSGGVEVREELNLEVRLSSEPASSGGPRPMDLEYRVTLFAGGRQVVTSRKTGRDKDPLAVDIPPVNLRANPMFKPPSVSDDPFDPSNRGVSILDAIGVAYGLLQDLFKDKTAPYQSSIEKKLSETYVFYGGGAEGGEQRVTAVVSLKTGAVSASRPAAAPR